MDENAPPASDAMRTERRRTAREHEAHAMHELHSAPDPAAHADWERLRPVIDQAFGDLGEADREAVLLRFFAGLPLAQVGARLNVSENAARMRVERALAKLEALLAKRGVTSTSAALSLALGSQAALAAPAGLAASVTSAALSGAAATSGAAVTAGIFGFMSTAKIMVGVALLAGAIGVGTAVQGHRASDRAEAELLALRRDVDAMKAQAAQSEARAREAEEKLRSSETRLTALQKDVESARTTSRPVAASESATRPTATRQVTVDPMLGHPEYFRLAMQKYRTELRQKFGLLYKTLNLSDEQVAKFESNRTDWYQATMEIASSADAQGTSTGDAGVSKLMSDAVGPIERELFSLLGNEGYKLYSQYNRTQAAFGVIKDLAGTVYRTDSPLTAMQGEQLAQAVLVHTQAAPYAPGSKSTVYLTDWSAVADQVRTILTPTQATAFQALLDARNLQERMFAISRAARDPATPTTKK